MNDFNQYSPAGGAMDMSVDAGLRSFMLGVYQKLCFGIALAGALAYVVGSGMIPGVTEFVLFSPFRLVVQWGPIALILASAFFMRNPSPLGSGIFYWAIVSLLGLSLSIWVWGATQDVEIATRGGRVMNSSFMTITKAFLLTSSAFGALSLFGYTTKMDLKPIGIVAFFALWGIVGIGIVSLFFPPSGMLETALMVGVLVISGILVAWDTQQLKSGYYALGGDQRGMAVMTNWGALQFFILFYNIFNVIMSFMSSD